MDVGHFHWPRFYHRKIRKEIRRLKPGSDEINRENTGVSLLPFKKKCNNEYEKRGGKSFHKNNFNPRESTIHDIPVAELKKQFEGK